MKTNKNKEKMIAFLEAKPKARERKFKNRAMAFLLKEKYVFLADIELEKIENILTEYATLDRYWRKVLEERPDLRGSDYGSKDILEQEKQIELGYDPNYERDNQKLKTL